MKGEELRRVAEQQDTICPRKTGAGRAGFERIDDSFRGTNRNESSVFGCLDVGRRKRECLPRLRHLPRKQRAGRCAARRRGRKVEGASIKGFAMRRRVKYMSWNPFWGDSSH